MAKRLRPLTDERPKCLLTVGSRTLLQRTFDAMIAAGISDVPYTNSDAIIYDMQGRRVSGSQLKKGAYIINNQKHIIP